MERLTAKILEHLAQLPEGIPVAAKELLHLASRAAIDQSLSRLVRRGQIMRAGRGRYVLPVETRFGKRPASVEATAQALASARGEAIAPSGAVAPMR
jgi:predicted transcriptional regulator of viral defense system